MLNVTRSWYLVLEKIVKVPGTKGAISKMVLDQGIIIIKGMAKTDVFPSRTVRSLLPLCLCNCSLHAARNASVGMCSGNSGLIIIVFTSKCQEIKKHSREQGTDPEVVIS